MQSTWLAVLLLSGCFVNDGMKMHPAETPGMDAEREKMVRTQIESRGLHDAAVIRAMLTVPRHEFVPENVMAGAYEDRPLAIGENQTISQPFIVALMTQVAQVQPKERVLEIGTGSGYQTAILLAMGAKVYTIEIVPSLAARAKATLETLYPDAPLETRTGDGYPGWPEAAPFDAIIVTAAPDHIPQPLVDQLAMAGRLVIPIGGVTQDLVVLTREAGGLRREVVAPVRFVPMTGEAQHMTDTAEPDRPPRGH